MESYVVVVFLLSLCTLTVVRGQLQCTPRSDLCSCVGNNFTINLGDAFQSPTYRNISDADDPDGPLSFAISPCVDIDCGGRKARACQYDVKNDAFVVLGTSSLVFWDVTDENNYVVTFGGGDPTYDGKQTRQAEFTGLVKNVKEPTFVYNGEDFQDTTLGYQFTVTYNSSKQCTPSSDKCSCVGNNFTINLGAAFQYPYPTSQNISDADDPDGPTSFVISPCVDIDCGEKKARACQYDIENDAFVVLGTTSSVVWTVTDENNYVVTFGGGDPTYDGKKTSFERNKSAFAPFKFNTNYGNRSYEGYSTTQAEFTGVVKDVKEPTFSYDGVDQNQEEVLPYKFMVMYNNSKLCTPSSDMCSCVGNNLSINLGAAFQSPTYRNISDPKGPFYYIVSPCVDFDCGGRKSRVCQYYIKENAHVVLGSGDTGLVTWNVTDSNNFIVTYRGGDKTYDGKERETVIFGMIRDVETASYTYNGEEMGSHIVSYKFGVIYNNQAPACTIVGVDMQSLIIVAAIGMLLCIVAIILSTVMLVTTFVVYKRKVKSIKYTHIQDKH